VHGPPCIEYQFFSSFFLLFSLSSFFSSFSYSLPFPTAYFIPNRMPFLQSPIDAKLLKTPSLPPPDYLTSQYPSSPDQTNATTSLDQMNPYQLIALKARQATKEREAKRKARLLEWGSQNSGSGSSGVMSSGESSLGDGSFPRERSEWGRLQTSTTGSLSIPSSTPSTVESSESQPSRGLHDSQSVLPFASLSLTHTTTPTTPSSSEYYQQISNGPVPSPMSNGMNDISHDTTMEEEDDDADLKRLMNQAQAMLTIPDNPSQPETGSRNITSKASGTVDDTELGREKVLGTSALADLNDERR